MALDRKKFKATTITNLKKQEKEVMSKTYANDYGDKVDFLTIEDGPNKFRIFPAHNEGESFVQARSVAWLPRVVEYEKEGKKVREEKRRPVFNSKVHAGTKKDLVEEFVKFAIAQLNDELEACQLPKDKEAVEAKLDSIKNWKTGVNYKTTWVSYANKLNSDGSKTFGFFEMSNGAKEKMNEIAIVEDASETITTDPFTDPDEGKAIILTKNSKAEKAKDTYKVTLEFRGNYALTDKELEEFDKLKPLSKIYVSCFKRSDYQIQLDGLRLFDEKNNLGMFDNQDFIKICEEISNYYPEDDETQNPSSTSHQDDDDIRGSGSVEEKAETTGGEGDDFTGMTRDQLKYYIKKETNNAIIVRSSMSDDDIRESLREYLRDMASGKEEEEPESDLPWEKEEAKAKKDAKVEKLAKEEKPKVSNRLAEVRKKSGIK